MPALPPMSERLQRLLARHVAMQYEIRQGRRSDDLSASRQLLNDGEVLDWIEQMDKRGLISNVSYTNGRP